MSDHTKLVYQVKAARRTMIRLLERSRAVVEQVQHSVAVIDGLLSEIRGDQVPLLETPLSELDLSTRAYHAMCNEGYKTVRDLTQRTQGDLLRMPNFGQRSLREVQDVLAAMGLRLRLWNEPKGATGD